MRLVALSFLALAAVSAAAPDAEAQYRRRATAYGEVLVINVRPRSYLDAGTVVQPGSLDNPATSGRLQVGSYLLSPPYAGWRERYGESVLPDPITNGPFAGARNPFGPIDFSIFDPPRYYSRY